MAIMFAMPRIPVSKLAAADVVLDRRVRQALRVRQVRQVRQAPLAPRVQSGRRVRQVRQVRQALQEPLARPARRVLPDRALKMQRNIPRVRTILPEIWSIILAAFIGRGSMVQPVRQTFLLISSC